MTAPTGDTCSVTLGNTPGTLGQRITVTNLSLGHPAGITNARTGPGDLTPTAP